MVDKEREKSSKGSELSEAALEEAWQAFLASLESPYITQMLARSEVTLQDGQVHVKVDHPKVKDTMTMQFNWTKFIRQHLGNLDIQVNYTIELDASKVQKRRPVTNREKLDALVEKNPMLLDFIKEFKLKFDS